MRGTIAHESRNQTLQAIADVGALKNELDALNEINGAVNFLEKHVVLNFHNTAVKRLREAQAALARLRKSEQGGKP